MSITIDLSEEALALLRSAAAKAGRTVEEMAAERLADSLYDEIDWGAFEGVRRGLDSLSQGDVIPLDDFIAERRQRRGPRSAHLSLLYSG